MDEESTRNQKAMTLEEYERYRNLRILAGSCLLRDDFLELSDVALELHHLTLKYRHID
jgi:hypothetical protein